MRRFVIFALILSISLGTARRVSAATDCSQWLAQYKQKLEDSQQAQRLLRASRRAHAYLKRKVIARPKPKPVLVKAVVHPRPRRPKMTPLEMLRRFSIVCGDLPSLPEEQTGPLLPLLKPASFTLAPASLPPADDPAPPVTASAPVPPTLVTNSPPGDFPIPPISISGPPSGPPIGPPIAPPVPEPSTLLLVGSAAAAFAGRALRSRRCA